MLKKQRKKRERKKKNDSHVLKNKVQRERDHTRRRYIFPYHPLSTHMHILIRLYD
jgi:hypothetical protein